MYIIHKCKEGNWDVTDSLRRWDNPQHVRRLWDRFCKASQNPDVIMPRPAGRRSILPSHQIVRAVTNLCQTEKMGIRRVVMKLRENGIITSQYNVYRIIKAKNLVVKSPAKSRRHKWVRFERKYSNAMWHADWHVMKDPCLKGLDLVVYLDDSSRCLMAARVFTQATSENAVLTLHDAIKKYGQPATILSDNGSCFVGVRRKDVPTKSWQPTAFEAEILNLGIELINSRPHHPQINGKLERFHRTIEDQIGHWNSLSEYVRFYSEETKFVN